ncbi:2TM domain-containing protein [Trichothermofontia sp.]
MSQSYRQEDVQQILQLAIARQTQTGEFTQAQLQEIAAELGISPDDLQAAEREWLAQREALQELHEFNTYRRARWKDQVVKYVITNAFLLAAIVVLHWQSLLAIPIIWGMALALETWRTFQTSGEDYERALQQWRRKRQIQHSVNRFLDRWLKG